MSTDLDNRLRSLTELSAPTRPPLGSEELHQRADRVQHRALALRVVPAAIVVLVLLAGAVIVRRDGGATDVLVGPPDSADVMGSAGLSESDQQVVDLASAASDLAHQVDREMLLSATFAATGGTAGGDELGAQRVATDAADATYRAALDQVDLADGWPDADEARKQALNRLDRLPTNRRSVDEFQTDPFQHVDAYANITASLVDFTMRLTSGADGVELLRGLLTSGYAGVVAAQSAETAALITVSVEAGFYGEWARPAAGPPTPAKGLCGDDADAAKDRCPAYWTALQSQVDTDQSEQVFLSFASGPQKQLYRAANAGSEYDYYLATAFEDGVGINDLRGVTARSVPIDPVVWRSTALDLLDRFDRLQQQLLDGIGQPTPEPSPPSGGAVETLPPGTAPAQPGTDTTIPAPTTTGP